MTDPEIPISPALGAWLALRRVDRGSVVFDDGFGMFFDRGRRVPTYLYAPFHDLVARGYLLLHHPAGVRSYLVVDATEAGRGLYADLCEARRLWVADRDRTTEQRRGRQRATSGDRPRSRQPWHGWPAWITAWTVVAGRRCMCGRPGRNGTSVSVGG
ncbi:MAG: hypothetical protein GEV28_15560 [Actinophytocola sp.]|uniref:hypothetical protein n=1 Tax=Actinophytocola sp. TaxID=1872138 RepID=UPI0013218024|nr:hypothetical protein [Actinophytocola sp.]MPZ81736.1 hypothetical protein [Actinophytocola sp.]